ncbi:hypothetical protein TKK_0009640 [Trichogramma kaykai]|uniref:2-phosphoxylose phosphatase 1 n=1 Tax=Trichogramma kaykai TaxID=54128 RepID=A0ABD2X1G7_9HYME
MTTSRSLVILCAWLLILELAPLSRASAATSDELRLCQLSVVFRHGDRMPDKFPLRFPNDPNMHEDFEPGGLINEGKRRVYRLGELLRKRYGDFLGTDYEEGKVFGLSSYMPRTMMSLQLMLSALYPAFLSKKQRWHENLNWQPIPARYLEFKKDTLFSGDKCDLAVEEQKKVFESDETKIRWKEYEPYLEDLRLKTGKESPINWNDLLILHNNLDIENRLNMTMLPWMKEVLVNKKLEELRHLFYELTGKTELLRRYLAGDFIRRINEDILKAKNEPKQARKISVYSGHDKNIISLLQHLKIYQPDFPDFSAALIFELLSQNSSHYVRIWRYQGIPEEFELLQLPKCDTLCPLDDYLNITRSLQMTDDEVNCVKSSDLYFDATN